MLTRSGRGAFPMARRKELFDELQPLVTDFDDHPWALGGRGGWPQAAQGRGEPVERRQGPLVRSRCGRSGSSRSATTTWRASGSGTPPSSYGGARTAIPRRAGTANSRSRCGSIWPTSWPAEFPRRGCRSDACSLLPPSQETSRGTAGVACRSARNAFVFPFTEALNNTQNYVASRTLQNPLPWSNSNPRCPSPRPGSSAGGAPHRQSACGSGITSTCAPLALSSWRAPERRCRSDMRTPTPCAVNRNLLARAAWG